MLLWALAACLPHGAAGGGGRLQARAWWFTVDAAGERCEGRLSLHYAEAFRDGSLGWLACLDDGTAPVDANGCLELRSFPTGEVLELRGLGEAPDVARLDVLWPLVSPALGRDDDMLSWPLYAGPRETRRVTAVGRWTGTGSGWSLAASLGDNDPELASSGELSASLRARGGSTHAADWTARRRACAGTDCADRAEAGRLVGLPPVSALPPEAVAARVAALAREDRGSANAAAYVALLLAPPTLPGPGCPVRSSLPGNLVESALESRP